MEIKGTVVFQKNWSALTDKSTRFIVNQGGSRSSKTYSLCQVVILYCLQNPNKVVSIVRKTFPALRATVMRDFFEVMKEMDLYEQTRHNKTEHTYIFKNGSMVEFFSVDNEQKIRGRKRDLAWANEANELWYDDFLQLNMRTTGKMIFDYNPSDSASWLYELPEEETVTIKSTYKDNPFLPESIKRQIEDLKRTDEALYQIYALGERAISKSNIYNNWSSSS
jgi:phage terminase large subunit